MPWGYFARYTKRLVTGAIRNLTQRTKDAHGRLWGLPSAGHGGVQTLGPGGHQGGITRL